MRRYSGSSKAACRRAGCTAPDLQHATKDRPGLRERSRVAMDMVRRF